MHIGNFFCPRSVAVVGASPQRGSARNTILRVLQSHGFAGDIYPVSRGHTEIEGLKVYSSIDALPTSPDVALVITPASTVPDIIAECGQKGIRNAIVFSSGFEEVETGKDHARRLAQAAQQHKVAVIGPNCQGVWAVKHKAILSFGAALLDLKTIRYAPIAVVSQSGALAGAIGGALQSSGMGCSYIASVGNETCLDSLDVLNWIVEQDDVRVAALYIEGFRDAARILRIGEIARSRGIQLVALKAGKSAVGQEATASHTGKIASPHRIYSSVLEQAGVICVSSLNEVLAAVESLAFIRNPRVKSKSNGGVAVVSSSGGAGALLADHCDDLAVPMAKFSSQTATALDRILPEFARKENPIDLTGQIYGSPELFKDACLALKDDPRVEALVVQFASSGKKNLQDNIELFKTIACEMPLITSFVGDMVDGAVKEDLRNAGILVRTDPLAAMHSLQVLYKRQKMATRPQLPSRVEATANLAAPRNWEETMSFCERSGIRSVKWVVLESDDTADKACRGLNFPVVVKVLPTEAEHKSEFGLVKLRVQTASEVDAHAATFRHQLNKPRMPVLVQEMVGEGVEVVLSCMRERDFGPVLSFGMGGIAVELYGDIGYLALPVSEEQVRQALSKLKVWTLLLGYRGKPAADIDALAKAAVKFGDLFTQVPELAEFEINPVIVLPEGRGLVAVDALVKLR